MELATLFMSKTRQNYTKLLTVPEKKTHIKKKVMLAWKLFLVLLTSGVMVKETLLERLWNIFKTRKVKTLTKTILESLVLQGSWKLSPLKQPVHFLLAINLLAIFNAKIVITFALFNQIVFFKNCTLASQNRIKFSFLTSFTRK